VLRGIIFQGHKFTVDNSEHLYDTSREKTKGLSVFRSPTFNLDEAPYVWELQESALGFFHTSMPYNG